MLVLTMFDDDDSVFAAMRAGARGYLLKGAEQDEIVPRHPRRRRRRGDFRPRASPAGCCATSRAAAPAPTRSRS